jgi:hypothetical protein
MADFVQAISPSFTDDEYSAVCSTVIAGTREGLDAPPPVERSAIRKFAQEWFNASLDINEKGAMALPKFAANAVGLMSSPSGHGSLLLAISALGAWRPHVVAENLEIIHKRMNHWLSDPDLVGVRDDQWLAKLPADEQGRWRKLWAEVRSLRDRTAPRKTAAPLIGK